MPKLQNKRPTASDVARLAGVSQSTVSRVFYPRSGLEVQKKTRDRVLEAAKELGYVPNAIAKIMVSGKSGIIGIVVPSNYNLFHYQALQALANNFKRYSLHTMVITSVPTDDISELLIKLSQYQVDGVIITSAVLRSNAIGDWTQIGIPIILFNSDLKTDAVSTVQSDHYGSGAIMADHLIDAGYSQFAFVSANKSPHWNLLSRQAGFTERLAQRGFPECAIVPASYSYESGLEAGRAILRQPVIPNAVFCSGDLNAYGVIDAIRNESKLRIGADIAVAGYSAPLIDSLQGYSMTSLEQRINVLAKDAAIMMHDMIETPNSCVRHIVRPMKLLIRASTTPEASL